MSVKKNLEQIKQNIKLACKRSQRNTDDITIIGVTKYVTIERTKEAIEAGITHVGENRTDEFLNKYEQVGEEATWHFKRTLQSRKARDIIEQVDVIHSLDRMSLAKQINKRATKPIDCFVQVNVSGEETKHGLSKKEVLSFIENLADYENIHVIGLMTMAPHIQDENKLRDIFKQLAMLRDQVKAKSFSHAPCTYLSMGMSNDYEIAIEEVATHIRSEERRVG